MAVYVVLVELMIVFSYHNNRMFYDENFIQVKSGIWDISKKIIETEKSKPYNFRNTFGNENRIWDRYIFLQQEETFRSEQRVTKN